MIEEWGATYSVEPALIRAVIAAESAWNPSAVSSTGSSYGLMQLNIAAHGLTAAYAFDPSAAIGYGTRLLGDQLRRLGGDLQLALAAYNAGTGRTAADLAQRIAGDVNGVGTYVRTVLDYLGYYRGLTSSRATPVPTPPAPDAYAWGEPVTTATGDPAELGGDFGAGGVIAATPGPELPVWGLLAIAGVGIVVLGLLLANR